MIESLAERLSKLEAAAGATAKEEEKPKELKPEVDMGGLFGEPKPDDDMGGLFGDDY